MADGDAVADDDGMADYRTSQGRKLDAPPRPYVGPICGQPLKRVGRGWQHDEGAEPFEPDPLDPDDPGDRW